MERKYKLTCPKQYDMIITAELPNKKKYPELYKMVTKHMMLVLLGRLIHTVRARWATGHARTITRAHSMKPRHRERIRTPSIGDAMTAVRKKFEAITWTINGSFLTTLAYYVPSTAI